MLWFKAFHIIFVVTWFAGLFYLPRLYVYHSMATDAPSRERFQTMERKLFVMMTMGAALTLLFGLLTLAQAPAYLQFGWMHAKLTLVFLLLCYHFWCYRLLIAFRNNTNRHSHRWYRLFNEVPTLLLAAIVILVVVKPF